MGIFAIDVEIADPSSSITFEPVRRIMIDTGSELTWISAATLRKARIEVRKKEQPFLMANGETVTRDLGYAIIRYREFETVDEVVFARESDFQLLGSRTLEGFNAMVDPARKRLVSSGPMPAALFYSATGGCCRMGTLARR